MKHVILNREFGPVRTVVVLGTGRGGTSVVAGTLRALGVCMGENPHPLKHEWSPVVYTAEELPDLTATARNVAFMDARHNLWGWKWPVDIFALDQVLASLRAPGVIVVTRDMLEVAISTERYVATPLEIGLYETATVYGKIADRLRFWPCPALLLSFHELCANPEIFVEVLCKFLQLEPAPALKENAVHFIQPGANTYRTMQSGSEFAVGLSESDMRVDTDGSIPGLVDRYTKQYAHHFRGMLEDAKRAIAILFRPDGRAPLHIPIETSARVSELLAGFRGDARPAPPEREPRIPNGDDEMGTSAKSARTSLESALEELHSDFLVAANRANVPAKSLTDFRSLTAAHRALLILIRVRIELQKGIDGLNATRLAGS